MNPHHAVRQESGKGVVVLVGVKSTLFRLLGSSLSNSNHKKDKVNSLVIVGPEKGKKGLIAISARPAEFTESNWYGFLLPVTTDENGQTSIDVEKVWVPDADRIGQIIIGGKDCIAVKIGEEVFVSEKQADQPDWRVVDGDTLCRYLIRDIDAPKVLEAASEIVFQKGLQEMLRQALLEVESLRTVSDGRGEEINRLTKENSELLGILGKIIGNMCDVRKSMTEAFSFFNLFVDKGLVLEKLEEMKLFMDGWKADLEKLIQK